MRYNGLATKPLSLGIFISVLLGSIFLFGCSFQSHTLKTGKWDIAYDEKTGGINVSKGNKRIVDNLYATYEWKGRIISTHHYTNQEVTFAKSGDGLYEPTCFTIHYRDENLPLLTQHFYVYPDKDYLLTEFTIESKEGVAISTDYMAPVNVDKMPELLNKSKNNRALFVPSRDDRQAKYKSYPLTFDTLTSYEVTAIFDNNDRHALIIGSVEQNNWQTTISIGKSTLYNIASLTCLSKHGDLKGSRIKSPKIFFGFFEDWRDGLEEYGRISTIHTTSETWDEIKEPEYMLNYLSYGWWKGYIYRNNNYINSHDAFDNTLEAENRLKITLNILAGLHFYDDGRFGLNEKSECKPQVKRILPNMEINMIANGKVFRPVEGNGEDVENKFVRIEEDGSCYCALFNYTEKEQQMTLVMERLGLSNHKKYQVNELWRRIETSVKKHECRNSR